VHILLILDSFNYFFFCFIDFIDYIDSSVLLCLLLGIEMKAWHMPGKLISTGPMPPDLLFLFFIIVVLGVHCSIYKSSYNIPNISYLNSPPSSFYFTFPPSTSWNSFNRSHFSIYTHMCTVFAPYSTSYILSPHPPPLTGPKF
jgi:hypothetical protein